MTLDLSSLLLPPEGDARIRGLDVEVHGVKVPVALSPREGSDALVVFYNGAVNREIAPDGRVFQRSKWADEVQANCLYISDPGVIASPSASLRWGQVNSQYWGGNLYGEIVHAAGELLGIGASRRLHYGSSAGGYQALIAATVDEGSRVVVNNPQTNWLEYNMKTQVNGTIQQSFPGLDAAAVVEQHPERALVWEWFRHRGYVPPLTYLLNTASPNDMQVMAAPFQKEMLRLQRQLSNVTWNVHYYSNVKQKHNPLTRELTLEWIHRTLRDMQA